MKNILFATSEAVPFIKTGGLADVAGSLPKYFDKRYFDIRVILPKYACMKQEWKDKMKYITHFYMDLGYKNCYVGIIRFGSAEIVFIVNEIICTVVPSCPEKSAILMTPCNRYGKVCNEI